jgi:hypothetical protein
MLESFPKIVIDETVFRIANPLRVRAALVDLKADLQDALETIDFLGMSGADDAEFMLNAPFQDDPTTSYKLRPTRFSDGTWKVFYSALETETAEAEMAYWCRRELQSEPPGLLRLYYRELKCHLRGKGYDLRPMRPEWPFLTGEVENYSECQAVARKAKEAQADAMLCPSARLDSGTTSPVFVRPALSEAAILGLVIFEIDEAGAIKTSRQVNQ